MSLAKNAGEDALEVAPFGKGRVHRVIGGVQIVGQDANINLGAGSGALQDVEKVLRGNPTRARGCNQQSARANQFEGIAVEFGITPLEFNS